MKEFKGIKGKWTKVHIGGYCIGVGSNRSQTQPTTEGVFTEMVANTILPDTDKKYEEQKGQIKALRETLGHTVDAWDLFDGFDDLSGLRLLDLEMSIKKAKKLLEKQGNAKRILELAIENDKHK